MGSFGSSGVGRSSSSTEELSANFDTLRGWHIALANATPTSPAVVMNVGDSISAGWIIDPDPGSDPATNYHFLGITHKRLNQRLGATNGVGYRHAAPGTTVWSPAFSASPGYSNVGGGPGRRGQRILVGQSSAVNQDVEADRILLHYLKENFTTGALHVVIDGVDTNIGSTFDGTLPAFGTRAALWDSGPLTPGPHSLSVNCAGAGGTSVVVNGFYANNGDAVQLWEGGHYGYKTSDYTASVSWRSAVVQGFITPHLWIVELGINDYARSANKASAAAAFKADMQEIIGGIQTDSPLASVVLMVAPITSGKTAGWHYFVTAYEELAEEFGVALFRWDKLYGNVDTDQDPFGLTFPPDHVHPVNRAHRVLGEALAAFLGQHVTPFGV